MAKTNWTGTMVVKGGGETVLLMEPWGTLSMAGPAEKQAEQWGLFLDHNNAELVSIDSDDTMTLRFSTPE